MPLPDVAVLFARADSDEIASHQAAGWYASPATLNWIKPNWKASNAHPSQ